MRKLEMGRMERVFGWYVSGGDQNMDWMGYIKMNGMRIWTGWNG